MNEVANLKIENAETMTPIERLEAAYLAITNTAIKQLENDLEVAQAMGDDEKKKLYKIQIGMYRHNQSIFETAKRFAFETPREQSGRSAWEEKHKA